MMKVEGQLDNGALLVENIKTCSTLSTAHATICIETKLISEEELFERAEIMFLKVESPGFGAHAHEISLSYNFITYLRLVCNRDCDYRSHRYIICIAHAIL